MTGGSAAKAISAEVAAGAGAHGAGPGAGPNNKPSAGATNQPALETFAFLKFTWP